jgi:outer membrane protein TolC
MIRFRHPPALGFFIMERDFPTVARTFPMALACILAWGVLAASASAAELPGLTACLDEAMRSNPRIVAAQSEALAALRDADAARLSFRAPTLSASAGQVEEPIETPFGSMGFFVPQNALSAQLGVEAPLAAGVYGAAGARQMTHRTAGEADGDDLATAGARLRIPLWRDRGFHENRLEVDSLSAESRAQAAAAHASVLDELSGVALAYAQLLFQAADAMEVARALERAEALAKETADRAELQDVAEYHLFPARYEVAVRREELAGSKGRITTALDDLSGAVGRFLPREALSDDLTAAGAVLDAWAQDAAVSEAAGMLSAAAVENIPEVFAARESARSKRSAALSVHERDKPSLDVLLGMGWGSRPDEDVDRDVGYGAAVVFSTPLSRDGVQAKIEAAEARADAARADADAAEFSARVRHAQAVSSFTNACSRLAMAEDSVTQARFALEAENARFSIGDGSSRNVLDAQKDLTNATRRKLAVAFEVVASFLELRRSSGLPPLASWPPDPVSSRPAGDS